MALFAAIGDKFISVILKQVATDYNLNYKELKGRYCGQSSFEYWNKSDVTKEIRDMDMGSEDEPESEETEVIKVPAPKTKVPKVAKEPKATKAKEPKKKKTLDEAPTKPAKTQMPLSKMKKADLEAELGDLGLDIKGTVPVLKARLKAARENPGNQESDDESPVKPSKPAKPVKPVKTKASKKAKTPEPEPELELEDPDNTCQPCDETQLVEEDIIDHAPLMTRLQAILGGDDDKVESESDEESDEEEDENTEDQQETPRKERWEEIAEESETEE
jgi:hypothetical protein